MTTFLFRCGVLAVMAAAAVARADDKPVEAAAPRPAGRAPVFVEATVGEEIRVLLRSGGSVTGVVLAKSVWERRDVVHGWVPSKKDERGSGVRLWFTQDLDGFQWVSVAEIMEMKSLGVQDEAKQKEGAQRREEASKKADDARRQLDEKRQREDDAAALATSLLAQVEAAKQDAVAAAAFDAAKKSDEAKTKRWAELLARFPPEKWGLETPKEIDRRRTVLHLFPSEDEQEFLKVFAEWSEAFTAWKKATDAATAAKAAKK